MAARAAPRGAGRDAGPGPSSPGRGGARSCCCFIITLRRMALRMRDGRPGRTLTQAAQTSEASRLYRPWHHGLLPERDLLAARQRCSGNTAAATPPTGRRAAGAVHERRAELRGPRQLRARGGPGRPCRRRGSCSTAGWRSRRTRAATRTTGTRRTTSRAGTSPPTSSRHRRSAASSPSRRPRRPRLLLRLRLRPRRRPPRPRPRGARYRRPAGRGPKTGWQSSRPRPRGSAPPRRLPSRREAARAAMEVEVARRPRIGWRS